MIKIGKLSERIVIYAASQSNDSADSYGRSDTYTQAGEPAWAEVRQISGARKYMDMTGRFVVGYQIKLRYNTHVKPGCRITWNDKYLYVNDVQGDRRDGDMTLMCYEREA